MSVAFSAISDENNELSKFQQRLASLIEEKDKMIDLKNTENKKYREQLLEAMAKNEDLTVYCRQLAN